MRDDMDSVDGDSGFGQFCLGDIRLDRRVVDLLTAFISKPFATISATLKSPSAIKAAYRFFGNKVVTREKLLDAHTKWVAQCCDAERVVLSIQDTTSANYSTHRATDGLGHIGSSKVREPAKGVFVHTALAVNTNGTPIGVLDQQIWSRVSVNSDGRNARKIRLRGTTLEAKESYRWISTMESTRARLKESTSIINVCDRESDIYEFMDRSLKQNSSFIIRAKSERKLRYDESDDEISLLSESFAETKAIAHETVEIMGNGDRQSRRAKISIVSRRIFLDPPERQKLAGKLDPLEVTAIHVVESEATGDGERISWLLLTDLQVLDSESAKKIVRWYSFRWRIEEFHKVLKSGCNIEASRLGTAEKLSKVITLKSIAAFRICQLTYLAREQPEESAEISLSKSEWKSAFLQLNGSTKPLPKKPPTLHEAVRWIAQLGGFTGRKNQNPGITTLWRGWQTLSISIDTWKSLSDAGLATYG